MGWNYSFVPKLQPCILTGRVVTDPPWDSSRSIKLKGPLGHGRIQGIGKRCFGCFNEYFSLTNGRVKFSQYNDHPGVSNYRRPDCLLEPLFRLTSKKTSKPVLLALFEQKPPVTNGFPSQRASNAETVSIWWLHHEVLNYQGLRKCFAYWQGYGNLYQVNH